jgi:branched-chain amino acid transport system substrate-binding protein
VPALRRRGVLAAGLAALSGVLPPRGAAAGAAAPPGAAEPWGFGALFPFSGAQALLGDESFRGLDLAAAERNAAGGLLGRPVRLLRGDAADPAQATAEVKRLVEQAQAAAIFGSASSTVSFAASAAAELAGVPYFELDAMADPITERGLKLLFRSGPLASTCGVLAVDTVADLLAPRWQVAPRQLKLVILHPDALGPAALAAAEERRCQERGLALAERIAYSATTLDLGPVVQRLRGAGVEVLLHTGLVDDVPLLFRTMKQAGWRPRMVVGAGGGYALSETAQALGPDLEGVMSVGLTPYHTSEIVAPGASEAASAYQRKYGAPPRSGHSLVSLAGARVFCDVIERAGGLDHDRLRAAVQATDIPPGATVGGWGVRFDERGQNLRAVPYLAQWQGGVLVTVAPVEAAVAQAAWTLGG